jgi:acyl carrier protein
MTTAALATAVSPSTTPHQAMGAEIGSAVMNVLRTIRARSADGNAYDAATGLTDAGFTSVEMVQVMLGIEAAFDLMIPQEMITPENFVDGFAITQMVERLTRIAGA